MNNLYTFLSFAFLSAYSFAQIKTTNNTVSISPEFELDKPYTYQLALKKTIQQGDEIITEVDHIIPIKLTLYSKGEGFNLFEWESTPMLFFKNSNDSTVYTFPNEVVKINYRTDENFILGEVSNHDEVLQNYTLAYQKFYQDEITNYDDLASKSSLYFVQMFHMFYGDEFKTSQKEQMMNLFFNPMKNTFSASEDAVTYSAKNDHSEFNFIQTYNTEMEDNSAKMMNHKTIDSYRNNQTMADYTIKAWGNQSYNPDGLVRQIERNVQVKQNDTTILFSYILKPQ